MSPIDEESRQRNGDDRRPEHDPVEALARRTGFSPDAVEAMRRSVARGGGRMAQFDHHEFGGAGQWMHGGLLMIADPSDHALKRRVDALCEALSQAIADEPAPGAASGGSWQSQPVGAAGLGHRLEQPTWYPASLGTPDTSGTQNDLRYAWFAPKRRLAVDRHGVVTLYDTGDHRIAGVSQQQGAGQKLQFVSQYGEIDLARLPVQGQDGSPGGGADAGRDAPAPADREAAAPTPRPTPSAQATVDPFVALEKLADLHARGIVDADEFATKKSELLKRI